MPLKPAQAIEQAKLLHDYHLAEREHLDIIRRYWKGRQALPAVIPNGAPHEVAVMSRSSRVNILPIVVNSLVQSAFVDGFRAGTSADDLEVWKTWQANRMDARQTAIHRAAAGYGTSYAVVAPGDPLPVIRGVSPRMMTTLYGEDPDWPLWGLEDLGRGLWKLYDDQAFYYLDEIEERGSLGEKRVGFTVIDVKPHGLPVTPIVRYVDEDDLDSDDEVDDEAGGTCEITRGQIVPLMPIQDQIDLTTFDLQISQHFGAFKQRWIIGWVAENERQAIKTAASTIMTFDENPEDMKIGEFAQTNLDGYIKSREASLRHGASLSQTPVHELIGELVNMSAEALAAAEAGKDRKVDERKTLWGESHEQTFWLVGKLQGVEVPDDSQVVWRDTSARAFAATVDALGKLASLLGVPKQELWERIPGTTQQDIERWKAEGEKGDAFSALTEMLDRQANGIT